MTTSDDYSYRADRRRFLGGGIAATLGLVTLPALAAAELVPTPRQSTGPFYPSELPLDHDNDLASVRGRAGIAEGIITHVRGRVLDASGRALPGMTIEIWQCNAFGRYHHPRDRREAPIDENFQGYGRTLSAGDGGYRFRTIRPVAYPGRTPHIHFAVSGPGTETLITQMYVAGEPRNDSDWLLNRIRDPRARASVIVTLREGEAAPGELSGEFDLVLGTAQLERGAVPSWLEGLRRSV
ncbi:MAG: intradiol ring-cleavage dioxygenase [Gammaproteobacteria bacterium]|nr:intradiol ring-cleavage dioxygenase [Gammaproteobacteria bacterium]